MKKAVYIVLGILLLLFVFGDLKTKLANVFWSNAVAPWEDVNAFYYPDKNDLTVDVRSLGVGSLEACRDWVDEQASAQNDGAMIRGDYECGVGCKPLNGDMFVCRLTLE